MQEDGDVVADVQGGPEGVLENVEGEVAAVVGEEFVVGEGVEHGARSTGLRGC